MVIMVAGNAIGAAIIAPPAVAQFSKKGWSWFLITF
jgi:hypothetical protein